MVASLGVQYAVDPEIMASSHTRTKRTGIFIYCSEEEKKALKRAAKAAREL